MSEAHLQGEKGRLGAPASTQSLKQRVLNAAGWTLGASIGGHVLRLAGNLILTRLLFPEAFGLMAIVQAVLMAVAMFSDLGLSTSIVRSGRGSDPRFLNTAWTLQILKGLATCVIMCVAAQEVARIYSEPMLRQLVPAMGITALLQGFASTKLDLARRNIQVGRVTALELASQVAGLLAVVAIAWLFPSPWALVWGNVVSTVARILGSHVFIAGPRNRLAWDRNAVNELFSFGSWVLLSSSLTFLLGEGRTLLVGTLVDTKFLGLMGLASGLSLALWKAAQDVSGRVLFPAYSEVFRSDRSRFSAVVERSRRHLLAPCWATSAMLAIAGDWLVSLLYDSRYASAGMLLRISAMGLMGGIVSGSYAGVFWAMGRARTSMILVGIETMVLLAAILTGHTLLGPVGVVIGIAVSSWITCVLQTLVFIRAGIWHPRTDMPVLAASALVVALVASSMDWAAVTNIR